MPGAVRNVLVWGAERIGDVVMTFPALKIIRRHAPQVHVTCAATDYASELVEASGLADSLRVLRFKGGIFNFFRHRRIRKEVKRGDYDRIVVFGKASRFRRHIASLDGTFCAADYEGPHTAERSARAVMDALDVGECPIPDPRIEVPDRPEWWPKFASMGLDLAQDRYLVVHAGCNRVVRKPRSDSTDWPPKLWPPEKYGELVSRLQRRFADLKAVVVGTAEEERWTRKYIGGEGGSVINLCGKTTVPELLQVLKHAALVVCGDSGVAHLTSVVGKPMVVLFGTTDERKTRPFGTGEEACLLRAVPYQEALEDPDCARKIPVGRVFREAEARLLREE